MNFKKYVCYLLLMLVISCVAVPNSLKDKDLSVFPTEIKYAKHYEGHLQGITTDYQSSIFWSHTTQLVKTDFSGNVIKEIFVPSHHGDLAYYKGKVYVAVNLGLFNREPGLSDSWIYIYDEDLRFIKKYPVPEVVHGAGGIAIFDGKMMIVGGLPNKERNNENPVYEYNLDLEFQKEHRLNSGYTHLGIQTAAYFDGFWYFGTYGKAEKGLKPVVLKAELINGNLTIKQIYDWDHSYGMIGLGKNKWLFSNKSLDKTAIVILKE